MAVNILSPCNDGSDGERLRRDRRTAFSARVGLFLLCLLAVAVSVLSPLIAAQAETGEAETSHHATVPAAHMADPHGPAVFVDPSKEITLPKGFILFFTGNWLGSLEPCGCAETQLGGIDRRTKILDMADPNRRLLLDSGPLIKEKGIQPYLKLEAFLRSLKQLGYDAITMTRDEVVASKREIDTKVNERPPIIASGFDAKKTKEFHAVNYIEKTLDTQNAKLRCLVLGLPLETTIESTNSAAEGPENEKQAAIAAVAAVETVLSDRGVKPNERSTQRLVIVMAPTLDQKLVAEIAKITAVDVVVTACLEAEPSISNVGRAGGSAAVITTGHMGKYLACLAVKPGDGATTLRKENTEFKAIAVRDDFIQDLNVTRLLDDYQQMLELEDLVADENKLTRNSLFDNNAFIGSARCGESDCHEQEYEQWKDSKHAHAMETLKNVKRLFDPECVQCHTVGMRYETGYRSMEETPQLGAVGCEMCHGPGLNHVADTYEDYCERFSDCDDCHDHDQSPRFEKERQEYEEKIRHWED